MIDSAHIERFIRRHRLPEAFRVSLEEHYLPLGAWLERQATRSGPLLVGLSGAQGTGKSTLADLLRCVLAGRGLRTAVLSLDDYYLTRAEREALAEQVHPLLATRGVPGTHDLERLTEVLEALRSAVPGVLRLPRFDKASDDRAPANSWHRFEGTADVILLEGWCIGIPPQDKAALEHPLNRLEREEDRDATWRHDVNRQLGGGYARLFLQLDRLMFLRAPSLAAVRRWRALQERKLAEALDRPGAGVMDEEALERFLQHFERLTRHGLATLGEKADVVIELDERHEVQATRYREPPPP